MNTLKEHFNGDFPATLKMGNTFSVELVNNDSTKLCIEIAGTLHLDFNSNSKFILTTFQIRQ